MPDIIKGGIPINITIAVLGYVIALIATGVAFKREDGNDKKLSGAAVIYSG